MITLKPFSGVIESMLDLIIASVAATSLLESDIAPQKEFGYLYQKVCELLLEEANHQSMKKKKSGCALCRCVVCVERGKVAKLCKYGSQAWG